MEFIFIFVSGIISLLLVYLISRFVHNHKELIKVHRRNNYNILEFHISMYILLTMVFFILLVTLNNTYWHYQYLTRP